MEGAILDRKLRHGHERTAMNLRKPVEIEKNERQLCSRRFEVQVDCRLQCRTSSAICKIATVTKF